MEDELEWGYRVPYAITGQLNRHPLDAIRWLKTPERNDFIKFYNEDTSPATPATDFPYMVLPCKTGLMSISTIDANGIQGAIPAAGGMDVIATQTQADNATQVATANQVDLDVLTTTS